MIETIIPHRDPFLFLDEVLELEPGVRVVARKPVTGDEWFFPGHFPGRPIMPGVIMVEALAQAGAIAALSLEENRGKLALFAGIDDVRFKRIVEPGDELTLTCELESGARAGRPRQGGRARRRRARRARHAHVRDGGPVIGVGERPRRSRSPGLGVHVPERVVTNDDLAQLVDTSDEWIVTRTGIRERRFAARRRGALRHLPARGPRGARAGRRHRARTSTC